jgi:magnesium transporter
MLPAPVAAGLLAASAPVRGGQVLSRLEPEAAGAIVAELAPGPASVLLRRLPKGASDALLASLSIPAADPIRRLLRYSPEQAGSQLDPLAPAVISSSTADEALGSVRKQAGDTLHYVYVVGSGAQLVGVVNLGQLMRADGGEPVDGIMVGNPQRLRATDRREAILRHPGWQHLHALPVVDADDRFLGVIHHSAFRKMQVEVGEALTRPNPALATSALAELLWLGTGAMGRIAEAAFANPLTTRVRRHVS